MKAAYKIFNKDGSFIDFFDPASKISTISESILKNNWTFPYMFTSDGNKIIPNLIFRFFSPQVNATLDGEFMGKMWKEDFGMDPTVHVVFDKYDNQYGLSVFPTSFSPLSLSSAERLVEAIAKYISKSPNLSAIQPVNGFPLINATFLLTPIQLKEGDSQPSTMTLFLKILEYITEKESQKGFLHAIVPNSIPKCIRSLADAGSKPYSNILFDAFFRESKFKPIPYLPEDSHIFEIIDCFSDNAVSFSCEEARKHEMKCTGKKCPYYLPGIGFQPEKKAFMKMALVDYDGVFLADDTGIIQGVKIDVGKYINIKNTPGLFDVAGGFETPTRFKAQWIEPRKLQRPDLDILLQYQTHLQRFDSKVGAINRIISDLSYDLGIMARGEILLMVLLAAISPDRLIDSFMQEEISGKVRCAILGDTGTGKTTISDKFHSILGGFSRIIDASRKDPMSILRSKALQLGANLVFIDEAGVWKKNQWEALRPGWTETFDRYDIAFPGLVSLFTIPVSHKKPYCEYLSVILNDPDIHRLTIAGGMRKRDLDIGQLVSMHKTTTDRILTNSVLWQLCLLSNPPAFSVDIENIPEFLEIVEQLILLFASDKIPLVTVTTFRRKFLRLCAALAFLLDPPIDKPIYIDREIVDITKTWIANLYSNDCFGLGISSSNEKIQYALGDITKYKEQVLSFLGNSTILIQHFYDFLCRNSRFSKREFMSYTQMDLVSAERFIQFLLTEQMLKIHKHKLYESTDKLRQVISAIAAKA